jgi:Putative peptidoglycan binding domain/LysM domain
MPRTHTVKPGECLSTIAARYGFLDYKTLYDHDDNAGLRSKRPNPNMIHPGDVVTIPDKDDSLVECATGKRHTFVLERPERELILKFLDEEGEPLANEAYELEVGDEYIEGTTDGSGRLKEKIPQDAHSATLRLGERHYRVKIGDLNPVEDVDDDGVSGVQGRLRNLGFDPGPIDGKMGPRTRHAIAAFQASRGVPVTGDWKGSTLNELKQAHGC